MAFKEMQVAVLALMLAGSEDSASAQAPADTRERCFGVALAGENDGIGETPAPYEARVDYQGNAWVWVPAGACLTLDLPHQPDGTPRRGSPEPLKRDAP
jgi:uncharacterized membrane protein